MMSDKVINRCLRCLEIIDIHSSGANGEINLVREAIRQQKTTKENRNKAKDRLINIWKNDREKMLWRK